MNLRSLALLSLFLSQAACFGGLDPVALQHSIATATTALGTLVHHHPHPHAIVTTTVAASSAAPASSFLQGAHHALEQYRHSLAVHPLQTKMITGACLATAGDAIAQSKEAGPYDRRRAASFATFDMAYRALQHGSFPLIVAHCQGQFLGGALATLLASTGTTTSLAIPPEMSSNLAALEQTLASQLGIVPFLYYPVFFGLTGYIQGLTMEGSADRAKTMFLPLMKRNLLFWIPVQFVQFGFIEESLQIPFLSVCGLAWTFILSIMAGSTKTYQQASSSLEKVVVPAVVEDEMIVFSDHIEEIGAIVQATASKQQETLVYGQP